MMNVEYRIIEMDTLPRASGAYAYDVDGALQNEGRFLQSQYTRNGKMNVKNGDYVFILINNPKYEIKYLCKIIDCDIEQQSDVFNKYEINGEEKDYEFRIYMQLELVNESPDRTLLKSNLYKFGLNNRQNHGNKVSRELLDYLLKQF